MPEEAIFDPKKAIEKIRKQSRRRNFIKAKI
jgi:hypothetical protein